MGEPPRDEEPDRERDHDDGQGRCHAGSGGLLTQPPSSGHRRHEGQRRAGEGERCQQCLPNARWGYPPHRGMHEQERLRAQVARPQHQPDPDEQQPPPTRVRGRSGLDRLCHAWVDALLGEYCLDVRGTDEPQRAVPDQRDRQQPEEEPVGHAAGEHAGRHPLVAVGDQEPGIDRTVARPGLVGPDDGSLRLQVRPGDGPGDHARRWCRCWCRCRFGRLRRRQICVQPEDPHRRTAGAGTIQVHPWPGRVDHPARVTTRVPPACQSSRVDISRAPRGANVSLSTTRRRGLVVPGRSPAAAWPGFCW